MPESDYLQEDQRDVQGFAKVAFSLFWTGDLRSPTDERMRF
jgi:hypothetical protein